MKQVIVFLADGMEECEALITVDLLRRGGIDVITASVMGRKTVKSAHAVLIGADVLAEEAPYDSAEMLILPGGVPGVDNICANATACEQIRRFAAEGRYLAAICAAPTVLAKLGVLAGKKATVFPGCESACPGALMTHEAVSMDGKLITGRAVGATFDFALAIIRALLGPEKAESVRRSIYYN